MRKSGCQIKTHLTIALVALAALLVCAAAAPAQTEGQLCIAQLGTDPAAPNPPTLDGVVERYQNNSTMPATLEFDPGWNGANKINLTASTTGTTKNAEMLVGLAPAAGTTPAAVWIAFTIETMIAPGEHDMVVLMLATDSDQAHDWRIFIKPFSHAIATGTTSTDLNFKDGLPDAVTYARGSVHWNEVTGTLGGNQFTPNATRAVWLRVKDSSGHPLTDPVDLAQTNLRLSRNLNSWTLEMKIPVSTDPADPNHNGIFFPPSGTFRMYANVLSTDINLSGGVGSFHDDPWPIWDDGRGRITGPLPESMGNDELEYNTPHKENAMGEPIWGTASLGPRSECSGISLAVGDIGVEDPASSMSTPPLIDLIRTVSPLPMPFPLPDMAHPTQLEACLALPLATTSAGHSAVNRFVARTQSNLSTTIIPSNLKVTFRAMNWGMPVSPNYRAWDPIIGEPTSLVTNPVGCSSTTTPCPPAGAGNFVMEWPLSYRQSCIYTNLNIAASGRGHTCIMVDLDSDDARVRFTRKSVARNMEFLNASSVTRNALISAIGYPALPAGRTKQKFIIAVDPELQRYGRPLKNSAARTNSAASLDQDNQKASDPRYFPRLGAEEVRQLVPRYFPKGVTEVMVWTARGYLLTGKHLKISGESFEYAEPIGGFAYVAGHLGAVKDWTQTFTGPGLTKVPGTDNLYTLEVTPGTEALVTTTIEAVEPPPPSAFKHWGLSLHAGGSFPHGNFGNFFSAGPNVGVDLEYRLSRTFSLEGIYTFHHFPGKTIGPVTVGDVNVHQFSFNGKVYGSSSPLRPFFNFGGGAYVFRPGVSTHGGLNIGAGVQRDITSTFAIEAMYNFHNVFTSGSNTRFSTLQGGVRFRF